ncbi:MAG: hypothetical protein R2818_04905 [Flavobacteriales bacterium]
MNAHIITPASDPANCTDFYERCGFSIVNDASPALVTDGQVLIEVDPDRFARAGLKCFNVPASVIDALQKIARLHPVEGGHIVGDPNGVRVYLMTGPGPMLEFSGKPQSILGNFAGMGIETMNMERSLAFWTTLGYTISMGKAGDAWLMLAADGCPSLSLMAPLMCPHLFFNPSLTYFNGKEGNPKVIAAVRKAGIPITEEITHFNKDGMVDNIIIRDPGGLGFFLFND